MEDADALTPSEQALFGEPGMPAPKAGWNRSRVVALFQTETEAREAAALLIVQDFLKVVRCWVCRPWSSRIGCV
ncbi:hypothetical protein Y695_03142 [Hydrogenophaga sp. T4]|nr:hypothetical protein Y695_03142 [Hydrogenophaga sp. T4]